MPIQVLMPALSPTMEKGNLAKWLKKEGETIKSGDVIAEIETDKATMEVEAADEGTLGKILVPEGTEDVAVNTPIAMILSACMMLDHLGETAKAKKIRDAIAAVVAEGKVRTYDMMRLPGGPEVFKKGAASTTQMADAIIAKL